MSSSGTYEIRRGADRVVYCNCRAWTLKQGRASCKHLDHWLTINEPQQVAGPRDNNVLQHMLDGDILEVNRRGVVFLMKLISWSDRSPHAMLGIQLVDPGRAQTSLRCECLVAETDVVRIVHHGGRRETR